MEPESSAALPPFAALQPLHSPSSSPASVSSDGASRCAYVTLLTRDSYLMGAQALQRSLNAVGSRHPLVVMYTQDTVSPAASAAMLGEGSILHPVQRYHPPAGVDHSCYKLALYAECWTKLRMWELEPRYRRLVYLDADMLVQRNVDHLFDLPSGFFYAAPDCAAGRQTQAERDACALLGYCQGARPRYFNAGMYVMTPSLEQGQAFAALLAAEAVPVGGYAEQDFLNQVFKDTWVALPPEIYNLQKGIKSHHPELWTPHLAAIIHYTDHKPWNEPWHEENQRFADIVQLWWQVFEAWAPRKAEAARPVSAA